MSQKILVTGAAGGVGRVLCDVLQSAGWEVHGLVRPEDDLSQLRLPSERVIRGYIQDASTVERAVRGKQAVVHCAALLPAALHSVPAAAIREVNVGGSLHVLEAATRHRLARACFFSTISVLDHVGQRPTRHSIREYIAGPHDPYLASKIELEQELYARRRTFPGHLSIVRPAFIYGPGNYAVWRDGIELTRQRRMTLIAGGTAILPLIYAEDLARFVCELLRSPPIDDAFDARIVTNPEQVTMRELFTEIAARLQVPSPRSLPRWPLAAAASVNTWIPPALRVGRLKLLTPARVRQYSNGYDLSGLWDDPILHRISLTPWRVGLSHMLDDYERATTARRVA